MFLKLIVPFLLGKNPHSYGSFAILTPGAFALRPLPRFSGVCRTLRAWPHSQVPVTEAEAQHEAVNSVRAGPWLSCSPLWHIGGTQIVPICGVIIQ